MVDGNRSHEKPNRRPGENRDPFFNISVPDKWISAFAETPNWKRDYARLAERNTSVTSFRSSMNKDISRCRVSSSGARNSEDGCTVAIA